MARNASSQNYLGNGGGNETNRPVSYYDNFGGNENNSDIKDYSAYGYEDDKYDQLRNEMLGFERAKSPTQTVSLLTTVPQNIAATNIAGRHAPTRNSLRHSRMIVTMHKTGKVPRKSMPPILRFHKLAKALVGLQVFLGIFICVIAFWLFVWTPNIRIRDNPYWSGIPLFLSGFIGVALLCCCRKEYPGMRNSICVYSFKTISIFFSTVAAGACLTAFTFALRHLVSLLYMDCQPVQVENLNYTCLCTLTNDTTPTLFLTKSYHYIDLHCPELNSVFFILLLISSCVCNFIGGILSLWYIYLHWSSRYLYTYSKVHTNNLRPTIIYNT